MSAGQWWWAFGSGAALGSLVTAFACHRLGRALRVLDAVLAEPERGAVRPNPAMRIVREES